MLLSLTPLDRHSSAVRDGLGRAVPLHYLHVLFLIPIAAPPNAM